MRWKDLTHWSFRVTDNGPGIDAAQRDKIFEPFKRLAQPKAQGLGLGLAICKKIVETHGGKIWCEAGRAKGRDFRLHISQGYFGSGVAKRQATERGFATAPCRPKNSRWPICCSWTTTKPISNLTRIMLFEEAGLQCNLLVARDAYEAMNILRTAANKTGTVDLLLLDINMPGMDGFELLENMRADDALRHMPVVMCTTSGYDKDMERAKALGALGYLVKPAEFGKLRPFLDRVSTLQLTEEETGYALRRVVRS